MVGFKENNLENQSQKSVVEEKMELAEEFEKSLVKSSETDTVKESRRRYFSGMIEKLLLLKDNSGYDPAHEIIDSESFGKQIKLLNEFKSPEKAQDLENDSRLLLNLKKAQLLGLTEVFDVKQLYGGQEVYDSVNANDPVGLFKKVRLNVKARATVEEYITKSIRKINEYVSQFDPNQLKEFYHNKIDREELVRQQELEQAA